MSERPVGDSVRAALRGLSARPPVPSPRLDVVIAPEVADGTVLHSVVLGGRVFVGTRPWTARERDGELARRIVRHGLAEVLAWLGEAVGPAPGDPIPAATGAEVLRRLSDRTQQGPHR